MAKTSLLGTSLFILCFALGWAGDKGAAKVKIEWDKDVRPEAEAPVDHTARIRLQATVANLNMLIYDNANKRLDQSHGPFFKVDGAMANPGITADGRIDIRKEPLPKKGGRDRNGYAKVWRQGDLVITQSVEIVPGRSTGEPRKTQMDAVLVHYLIENKGKKPHSLAMRTFINQRYGKFLSPSQPGKTLDGVEFKGSALPPYIEVRPNDMAKVKTKLATASNVYIALAASGGERPDRVVLSSGPRTDLWELPLVAGGVNPTAGLIWEAKEIAPGGKRELAYGYGTGVATASFGDVSFSVDLSGSFEVGKTFTLAATISDPYEGQSLELELPRGIERVEGKAIQPVPLGVGDASASMIVWKGRVLEPGRFPIRFRTSGGTTRTMIVTVGG